MLLEIKYIYRKKNKTVLFLNLPLTPTSGTGKSNCGFGFSFFACSQTNAVRPK